MAFLPPPPVSNDPSDPSFRDWFYKLKVALSQALDLSNVTGILGIGNGGTGTGDVPANGELLIGNGVDYTLNTLTAGSNITITNGAGTIQIDATGGGGSTLNNVISTPTTIPVDTSYPIIQYLSIEDDFTVEGNVLILDGNGGGSSGSDVSFGTVSVSGQSDVVADVPSDTLTLVAGSNVVITTDAATDAITISATGGGTGSVSSVTSANADITVATTTTTPVLTMVQTPALRSATTTVNVSSATAPAAGQVLTATSSTAATWQTPSGSGAVYPKVRAYANIGQSFAASTYTKVLYQNESFDTNNNFASSRFTPTEAGYYYITASVLSTPSTGYMELNLFKNGSDYVLLDVRDAYTNSTYVRGSAIIDMNGSTDYIEIYAFTASTHTGTSAPYNTFEAFRIS